MQRDLEQKRQLITNRTGLAAHPLLCELEPVSRGRRAFALFAGKQGSGALPYSSSKGL